MSAEELDALAEARLSTPSLGGLLLYDQLVGAGILMLRDGAFLAAWRYRGPDLASATHAEMATLSARLGSLLKLGSGWAVHVDAFRHPAPGYPERGAFPDAVTKVIDDERREQFLAEGAHFETETVLALTYLPPKEREERLWGYLFEGRKPGAPALAARALEQFRAQIRAFEEVLGALLPIERLGIEPRARESAPPPVPGAMADGSAPPAAPAVAATPPEFDSLLQYLRRCITGRDHPFRRPEIPVYLSDVLGAYPFVGGLEPELDREPLAVIAIEGFPKASHPGMLAALDALALEYRWSTRAILLDATAAKAMFDGHRRRWRGRIRSFRDQLLGSQNGAIDLDAQRMASEAETAMSLASAGDVQYALYTAQVILRRTNRATLERDVGEVIKTLRNLGFEARLEWVNAIEAWLGSLPGDGYRNVRRQVLHTLNLADLLPLTGVWTGEKTHPSPLMPKGSPPLLHAATTGSTPFRFHLHVSDLGHSLVVGPPGAGKSTALALLAAQWFRYPQAQVFAFDYRASLEILTLAAGGTFVAVGAEPERLDAEYPTTLGPGVLAGLCPLADLDSSRAQVWAVEWIEGLCALQGLNLAPRARNAVADAVRLLVQSPTRTLTELSASVQDAEVREALQYYTLGGPAGLLLDADHATPLEGRFRVFELEPLMAQGEKLIVPVLTALFRDIERSLTGAPTLVLIDEAWIALKHPFFRERLRDWLKTLRKMNACVVLATQNLSDIWNSPIRDVVFESCPTKILLPNSEVLHGATRPLYEALGLNARELELLAQATPKRDYYVTSPLGRRLISFGLGPVSLAFTAANSREDRARAARCRARHGRHWAAEWLAEQGALDWGRYLDSLQACADFSTHPSKTEGWW